MASPQHRRLRLENDVHDRMLPADGGFDLCGIHAGMALVWECCSERAKSHGGSHRLHNALRSNKHVDDSDLSSAVE